MVFTGSAKAKRKAPTNIYKMFFLKKDKELINVPYIFHDSSVKTSLPTDFKFVIKFTHISIQSGPKYLILIDLFLI